MRECGSCGECCWLMSVDEIGLGCDTPCEHFNDGCAIYEDRPDGCRHFECGWLAGAIPEEFKPDKVKIVTFLSTRDGHVVLNIEETAPRSILTEEGEKLLRYLTGTYDLRIYGRQYQGEDND